MQDPVAIHAYATARIAHMGGEPDEERERAYVAARAEAVGGMTLRDYFAGQAISQIIAVCANDTTHGMTEADYFAGRAYEIADAMLKARGQQ